MSGSPVSDYLSFLRELGADGDDYFIEGGQAVNFWAEYYSAKGIGDALASFRPFTSKDCDVWVSVAAMKRLRSMSSGKLIEGKSPADGQLAIYSLGTSPPRRVDIMTHVYGIPQTRLKQAVDRSLLVEGVRVIDPILLFQSKCHCLIGLDQTGRQDGRHVQMLSNIVPEHLASLLDEVAAGNLPERALIRELKLLQRILKTSRVTRALRALGTPAPGMMIPWKRLRTCGLPLLEKFAAAER